MTLEETLAQIKPLDERAIETAAKRWDSIAKPLHSLGELENMLTQIAGITGTPDVRVEKKAVVAMCADNGVVEEGVTQTGQEVTAIVAENFLDGATTCCVMCRQCGAELFPVDVGMVVDTKVRTDLKVAYGTKNMVKEPAMTREEALQAILTGVHLVKEKKEAGYQILATGEMGIGNTTTSSAVASVLLDESVETMTGRGAGLDSAGLRRKICAIKTAIAKNKPNADDPVDVLSKVGGFDLAGLVGIYLGGAYYHVPVIMDGFISAVAALAAVQMCNKVREYIIVSHVSKEPGMHILLKALGREASMTCDMCLGEGTGAVAFLPVLDMALAVYEKMSTFSDIHIDDYEELGDK